MSRTLTADQQNELHELAQEKIRNSPVLRKGQAYMIALHEISPEHYGEIAATDNDCFYDDGRMNKFFESIS